MFWNATTVPTVNALFGAHRPTIGILRIMSLSSWPRTWQCHRYHALVLGSTAATGYWFVPGWTPPDGVSWGAHRVISRRTSPRLARAVSFHPVSYGVGGICGPTRKLSGLTVIGRVTGRWPLSRFHWVVYASTSIAWRDSTWNSSRWMWMKCSPPPMLTKSHSSVEPISGYSVGGDVKSRPSTERS